MRRDLNIDPRFAAKHEDQQADKPSHDPSLVVLNQNRFNDDEDDTSLYSALLAPSLLPDPVEIPAINTSTPSRIPRPSTPTPTPPKPHIPPLAAQSQPPRPPKPRTPPTSHRPPKKPPIPKSPPRKSVLSQLEEEEGLDPSDTHEVWPDRLPPPLLLPEEPVEGFHEELTQARRRKQRRHHNRAPENPANTFRHTASPLQFADQIETLQPPPIIDLFGFRTLLQTNTGIVHNEKVRNLLYLAATRQYDFVDDFGCTVKKLGWRTFQIISPSGAVVTVEVRKKHILITGNPARFHQSDNSFCDLEPSQAIYNVTHFICEFFRRLISRSLRFVDTRIERIDLTQMIDCDSAQCAYATFTAIHQFLRATSGNGQEQEYTIYWNTFYFSQHRTSSSTGCTIKVYRKSLVKNPTMTAAEDKWIRVEISLRSGHILQLMRQGIWDPKRLSEIFQHELKGLKMLCHQFRPHRAKLAPTYLPLDLQFAWYAWERGDDLRRFPQYSDEKAYNRLVRAFMEHGIDIRQPPTPRSMRTPLALKLADFLDPRRFDSDRHSEGGITP